MKPFVSAHSAWALRVRRSVRPLVAFLLVIPLIVTACRAQDADLTLERIFSSRDFAADGFGPAAWLEDGSGYTTVEPSSRGQGQDVVKYDPGTGERSILVSAASLTPAGASTPLEIHGYSWSPDGSKFVLFTNSRRVWRLNTRGDYWVLDLATGRLQQLGGPGAREASLMFAKVSPDGTRAAYVRENNIYVENLANGIVTPLTTDGSETIINGTFDWVYEEEFGLRDGFRWSPDGSKIAYWQLDASGVGEFLLINNTDSLYSFTIPLQYPKAGTTNSANRIGVVSASGGATTWMQIAGDSRNYYLARMDWANNSDELIIQHLNRLQNTNTVLMGTAATGAVRLVMEDRDDAWLDTVDDILWMPDGRTFTWLSERLGYRQAWLVDRETGEMTLATPGAYDVLNVVHIDVEEGWLYFVSSLEGATERYLYRVRIGGDTAAEPERLTPAGEDGWHSYQISHDARYSFRTWSAFGTPSRVDLVALPSHEVVQTFVDNERLRRTFGALVLGGREFFQVDIGDGVVLDAYMITPSDFDPSKKYPLLFHVYGEPAGQTVMNRWGGRNMLWHHYLAEQGYVIMSVDPRGTPGPHGRDWRKMIYGEIGTIASQDQAAALDAIARRWSWVDTSRIGIWGWSGGGSMTLNMLFRYPEKYHVGMSVAPVPDQRLYDTIYQERYMGLPQQNVEGYTKGSPITYAEGLKGKLLLVHGTGDDNVHYQGSERLMNKLIALNKPFDVMVYPNRSHGIFEGPGTTRHLFELLTRYVTTHLEAGARLY
ncbi:MAG: S9 family peptidase [Bacteroidetes bacterium CG12_big_fil_rev_8_21_14_0_65_60_17]|nr:MAG: S9 family peptidase [Bacteroidetes bacterium CG12_big_fil_rev_8_21_14_0_65_60_17]